MFLVQIGYMEYGNDEQKSIVDVSVFTLKQQLKIIFQIKLLH